MANFVLVHGAFYGGWCWRRVTGHLARAGHTVFAPTLTGAGDRHHLISPAIGLETHVQDILNVFTYEDIDSAVLVGHSYGGVVNTVVADRIPERIAHLVYVDATIPENNQAATGVYSEGTADVLEDMSQADGDDWLLPPIPLDAAGVTREEDIAWVSSKRVPHPLRTLQEPVRLRHTGPVSYGRTYIHGKQRAALIELFGTDPLAPFADKARREDYRFCEIDTGHDSMVTEPARLADLLIEAAQG